MTCGRFNHQSPPTASPKTKNPATLPMMIFFITNLFIRRRRNSRLDREFSVAALVHGDGKVEIRRARYVAQAVEVSGVLTVAPGAGVPEINIRALIVRHLDVH